MSVKTLHPKYTKYKEFWERCRTVAEGEDAVKAEKDKYLPRLGGQDEADYTAYLKRASFYNATGRTIQGLLGAIFRKAPVVEPKHPGVLGCLPELVEEVLEVGRFGLLVDAPPGGGPSYLVRYKAEDILNWRVDHEGEDERLTFLVLAERNESQDQENEFLTKTTIRWRVLDLDPDSGYYRGRVFEEVTSAGKSVETLREVYEPMVQGARIDFIPFVFFNPTDLESCPESPPLLDLVNVNLSHYRTYADLEHGRHFTALPTAWVAGFPAEMELRVGATSAWVSDNPNAKAGFLEFTGQGLQALERGLEQKEHQMAVLGARLFESQKAGVEAAETVHLRQSADTATAATIAKLVSRGVTSCFQWMAMFDSVQEDVRVELNTDMLDTSMSPADISSYVLAWQQGAISQDTLLWNLKQGEVLPPDISIDDEKALIENDMMNSVMRQVSMNEAMGLQPSGESNQEPT